MLYKNNGWENIYIYITYYIYICISIIFIYIYIHVETSIHIYICNIAGNFVVTHTGVNCYIYIAFLDATRH